MITFSLPVWGVVLSLVLLLVLCVAGAVGLTVLVRQFIEGVPDFRGSVPINDLAPDAYSRADTPTAPPVDDQTRRDLFALARDEVGSVGDWRSGGQD
ncbi:MAG TPA: hypothetical protein V6D00_16075 [Pantanalinema sp.]